MRIFKKVSQANHPAAHYQNKEINAAKTNQGGLSGAAGPGVHRHQQPAGLGRGLRGAVFPEFGSAPRPGARGLGEAVRQGELCREVRVRNPHRDRRAHFWSSQVRRHRKISTNVFARLSIDFE